MGDIVALGIDRTGTDGGAGVISEVSEEGVDPVGVITGLETSI